MRNGLVDVVRFLGALGVVWFHAGAAAAWIGHAALLVFLMLAVHFLLEGTNRGSLVEIIRRRGRRLLVPFVSWSAVYLVVKAADALASGAPLGGEFHLWMLMTGPSLHLWFLPFIFLSGILVAAIAHTLPNRGAQIWVNLVLALAALALLARMQDVALLTPPFGEWSFGLPAIFLGAAMHGARDRLAIQTAVSLVFIGGVAVMMPIATSPAAQSQALAVPVVLVSLAVALPANRLTAQLAVLSFGIYLVHPLVLAAMARIGPPDAAILALLTMAGAALTTGALLRTPLKSLAI